MLESEQRYFPPITPEFRALFGNGIAPNSFDCRYVMLEYFENPARVIFEEQKINGAELDLALRNKATINSSTTDMVAYKSGMLLMQRAIREHNKNLYGVAAYDLNPGVATDLLITLMDGHRIPINDPARLFSAQQAGFIEAAKPYFSEGSGTTPLEANSFWQGAMDYNMMVNLTIRGTDEIRASEPRFNNKIRGH